VEVRAEDEDRQRVYIRNSTPRTWGEAFSAERRLRAAGLPLALDFDVKTRYYKFATNESPVSMKSRLSRSVPSPDDRSHFQYRVGAQVECGTRPLARQWP
jgi:hypothetical protein